MRSTPTTAATDQSMLRRVNEVLILEHMRGRSSLPLSDVSRATGLSWRTTNVVAEGLVTAGWLREAEPTALAGQVGRPARHFRFAAEAGHVAAIDIASAAVSVAIADLNGRIVHREHDQVDPREEAGSRLAAVAETTARALQRSGIPADGIWASTIATSGIVDPNGNITKSVVLRGWDGMSLGDAFGRRFGWRTRVENDCNLAALAEHWYGQRSDDLIYLLIGTRLGVGLIVRGSLHRGVSGAAGEIGELPELGWNTAAATLAAAAGGDADADADASAVFAAARRGDPTANEAVDVFVDKVARGLTAMILTIDPEAVVLGGSFSHAADLLVPRLTSRLAQSCVRAPVVAPSELGDASVELGAVRLALDAVLTAVTDLDSTMPLTPSAVRSRLAEAEAAAS